MHGLKHAGNKATNTAGVAAVPHDPGTKHAPELYQHTTMRRHAGVTRKGRTLMKSPSMPRRTMVHSRWNSSTSAGPSSPGRRHSPPGDKPLPGCACSSCTYMSSRAQQWMTTFATVVAAAHCQLTRCWMVAGGAAVHT